MNILVLGGNGYLGSKVIHLLHQEQGHQIVYTRRNTSDLSRLHDLMGAVDIRDIPASVDAIEAVTRYVKFDMVLNMACSYGRRSVLYENVIDANITFPLRVLNCAVEHGTKKFLTIGTGLPDELNMYSFSKSVLADFGKYYANQHGIDFYNLKLEMFYGTGEPRNRFIPSMIVKMLTGEDVNVTLGTQKRDIIAVKDILHAIMTVIHSDLRGYQEISVGTGVAPRISDLVDFIWQETGCRSRVNKGAIPMRENEPDCVGNPEVLRRIGDWAPVDWQTGIHTMIEEIKEDMKL